MCFSYDTKIFVKPFADGIVLVRVCIPCINNGLTIGISRVHNCLSKSILCRSDSFAKAVLTLNNVRPNMFLQRQMTILEMLPHAHMLILHIVVDCWQCFLEVSIQVL